MNKWIGTFYARPYGSIGIYSEKFRCEVEAMDADSAISEVIQKAHANKWETMWVMIRPVTPEEV